MKKSVIIITLIVVSILIIGTLLSIYLIKKNDEPKSDEIQEGTLSDEELTPDEYLDKYGICPLGYDLVEQGGERDFPNETYDEATKRLEEAEKKLEESQDDPEALMRAIKELEEATLYYHGHRCKNKILETAKLYDGKSSINREIENCWDACIQIYEVAGYKNIPNDLHCKVKGW